MGSTSFRGAGPRLATSRLYFSWMDHAYEISPFAQTAHAGKHDFPERIKMPDIEAMRRSLSRFLFGSARIEWVPACRSCGQRPAELDGLCSWCSLFSAGPDKPPGTVR